MGKAAGGREASPHRIGGGKGKTQTGPRRGTAGEDVVTSHPLAFNDYSINSAAHTGRTVCCSLTGSPLKRDRGFESGFLQRSVAKALQINSLAWPTFLSALFRRYCSFKGLLAS